MNSWTSGPVTLRLCDEDDWPLLYASLQDVQGRYWLQTTVEPRRTGRAFWPGSRMGGLT